MQFYHVGSILTMVLKYFNFMMVQKKATLSPLMTSELHYRLERYEDIQ